MQSANDVMFAASNSADYGGARQTAPLELLQLNKHHTAVDRYSLPSDVATLVGCEVDAHVCDLVGLAATTDGNMLADPAIIVIRVH